VAKLIKVVKDHSDPNTASLSVLEFSLLPWEPKRIYWLSNFKDGQSRGNHAHKNLSQIFIAANGEIDIEISSGLSRESFTLSNNGLALELEPGSWRVISNASEDALLMVLASHPYAEEDYIRNWDEYLEWHRNKTHE
jgi:hypothetical protein